MMARLYDYWRSSASYRVRIALGLAGIEFDVVPVDLLRNEQSGADYLAKNPQGLVPTLELEDVTITQSLAAIEYLDDCGHYRFLPRAPTERARVRTLSYAIAMEIHPVCNLAVANEVSKIAGDGNAGVAWMQRFMTRGLAAFEQLLDSPETGQYCHRDSVTMADVCLMPQAYNARRRSLDISRFPRMARIVERLESLEAFANAYPDNFK